MPLAAGSVDACFQRILNEISTISQEIRVSAQSSVNAQNCNVFERLCRQLGIIQTSASIIVVAITKASLTDYTIDDRLMDWLTSGEPRSCLEKLKEMHDTLKVIGRSRPALALARQFQATEDPLTAIAILFDKHMDIFHFLLTTEIWNYERHPRHQAQDPQVTVLPLAEGTQDHPHGKNVVSSARGNNPPNIEQDITIRRRKLDEALRWLSAFDCTDKHNSILELRQEGTCMWFPNTNAYENWRFKTNRFLWLHGKAGCGKSVLAASTIEHLKTTLRHGEVMVFFYFDFQNERSSTSAVMMRSLLSQLLRHFRDLNINPEDVPDKILDRKSKGTLSLDNADQMCDLVLHAVNCFLWYPLIVIDALDECVDIGTLLPVLDKLKLDDIRLLVTSRPYEDMMGHFVRLQSLSFQDIAKDVAADIALHVIREIDSHKELRTVDVKVKNEIRQRLNGKAEGRFRWVQCQLDGLKQCASGAELKEALKNLPNELETTYERILGKIDERRLEGKFARRTLVWLVVALNPLRLAQIVDGILFDTKQGQINYKSQDLRTFLLRSLSSLVSYSEKTDVLSLSHFSVKEYLTTGSRIALQIYYIVPHIAHADMVQMCMRYLSVFLKQEKYTNDYAMLSKSSPMLSYVLCYGFDHLIHVQSSSIAVLKELESLRVDVRHHPTHWDRLCELREEELRWPYPSWPSSRHDFVLYILIAYSSPGLLRAYLSLHCPFQPRVGTSALIYAADLRKTEHAIALLTYGADVDKAGLTVDDSSKSFPIDVAIDAGNDVLVGEFLDRGGALSPETISTAVCMPWCTIHVLAKLMLTENFANWAKEIGDERLYHAVFNSARPCVGDTKKADEDHVTLAHRLREFGVNFSPRSPFGSELIERALHAAHTSMLEYLLPRDQPPPSRLLLAAATGDTSETVAVIRFLLRRGANINVKSNRSGDTPLHFAAMCPWEPRSLELIQEMINAGGDPLVLNRRRETPLTIAMKREYINVVAHILSYKAPPPGLLSIALRNGLSPRMVELIICAGADMKWITSNGDTALHLAVSKYDESMSFTLVRRIIEGGCDPTACNFKGKTVMEAAIERRYNLVTEQLLLCNVQPPPNIIPIVLQRRSALQLVQILIRGGADVKSIASNGDTALHLAVSEYDESISLILLKRLIDAGCDPTTRNSDGKTVIEVAIDCGYRLVVEHLCSVYLPPNIIPTVLERGLAPQLVKILICGGADTTSIASNGDTALHLAISNYAEPVSLALLEMFITAGYDPTVCNSEGKTVMEAAIERSYSSVVEQLLLCSVQPPLNIILTVLQRRVAPQLVKILIRGGANVKSIASNEDTALHLAVSNYDESISLTLLKRLIGAGCDPTARNSHGKTVIEVAINRGYRLVVEHLCSVHFPPNIIPILLQHRFTPRIIDILVRGGANVKSIMSNGDTVLHLTISKYDESTSLTLLKMFIAAGCDPTTCNSKGKTVIEVAIDRGYELAVELLCSVHLPPNIMPTVLQRRTAPWLVEILICGGANVKCIASNGDTILHLAIYKYNEPRSLALVKRFIAAGCDPAARNSRGETAMEVALEHGYASVVEQLLLSNAQLPPNIIPTILRHHLAPQIITILIRRGADVKSITSDGNTVLHLAIDEYDEPTSLSLLQSFIDAGCDLTICNSRRKTVMEAAVARGYRSVVNRLLLSNVQFPSDIIPTALQYGVDICMIEFLILKGANMNATMSNGDTALHIAIAKYPERNSLYRVKTLIEAGCNLMADGSHAITILEAAMQRGYPFLTDYLLSRIDPRPPAFDILSKALRHRCIPSIIRLLVDRGASDLAAMSQSQWDTLLGLTDAASYNEQDHALVLEMLLPCHKGKGKMT